MSQQINLFNPIFLKQRKYFSAATMVQGLGLILLGCVLMAAYTNMQLKVRVNQAAATSALLLKTKDQLISVSTQFSPNEKNRALEEDIRKTEADIKSVQSVFDAMQSGEVGDSSGYSAYFRGFSRQIVDGLWLTGVTIVGAGREIGLQGRTLNPELVPEYLSRLKHEPTMQGKSFSALDMNAPPPASGPGEASGKGKPTVNQAYVDFDLRSSDAVEGGQPGGKGK